MKKQFFIFSLEPLETRYTYEWFYHLPNIFTKKLGEDFEVIQINGSLEKIGNVSKGAFLNFSKTNFWKNEQVNTFLEMFNNGKVEKNATILFTDAWNPTILELQYVKNLEKTNWKFIAFWHAGSYNRWNFLGRNIKDPWVKYAEKSFYEAYDLNIFATKFHRELFFKYYNREISIHKSVVCGFPMEYIEKIPETLPVYEKEDMVLFPQRFAPEKQPEIFKELRKYIPENIKMIASLENGYCDKKTYHEYLAKSKVVFSCSLQETLGITQYEALVFNATPLVPNRLSYQEMYPEKSPFVYKSKWIEPNKNPNFKGLAKLIVDHVENWEKYELERKKTLEFQKKSFFSSDTLFEIIKSLFF